MTRATVPAAAGFVEFLLVNDGELSLAVVAALHRLIGDWGARFRYYRTADRGGLFNARLAAITAAAGEAILFLDDDVEIEQDYLTRLVGRYTEWSSAAGIGGIDELMRPVDRVRCLFGRVFLLDGGEAGRLSASGFNGSMFRWREMREPFRTEYLSGCNMSFRRQALAGLEAVDWLQGYSQGEDVYLSVIAARTGPLWVDPGLRVLHHASQSARLAASAVAPTLIVSVYRILQARNASWWNYLALHWATFGLALKELILRGRVSVVLGYIRGLLAVERDLLKPGPGTHES